MKKTNFAAVAALSLALGLLAGPAISSGTSSKINACVSKANGAVRIASKCLSSERRVSWNQEGVQGSQGPQGPSGSSGSSFNLSNYPALVGSEAKYQRYKTANCRMKTEIFGWWSYDIFTFNEFGQPTGLTAMGADFFGTCPHQNSRYNGPIIQEVSNIVHSSKTRIGPTGLYDTESGWRANVTSFKVKLLLDSGWHLCSVADPQYAAENLGRYNTGWSTIDQDEFAYSGVNFVITWGSRYGYGPDLPSNDSFAIVTDDTYEADAKGYPYFCGPDSATSSGVGYRRLNADYFPVQFGAVPNS